LIPDKVRAAAAEHPYPLLFATVSGAHLYGFPSLDSDWDLRGVHILPVQQIAGLGPMEETLELTRKDEIELDLVTHDVKKFITLLLRPNGYVLEQLHSPIVVVSTPEHVELKELARGCLTKHHVHHYLGFADNQWKLFSKEESPRIKPLLYTFRVLLTGIHLMREAEIEANLVRLNELYPASRVSDLIERKREGVEREFLGQDEIALCEQEIVSLRNRLVAESASTLLPESPSSRAALNDLLIRIRLKTLQNG
jgi:predicted nucleotidyltransferase